MPTPPEQFQQQITAATERATASGALQPILTEPRQIIEHDVPFLVHLALNLQKKSATAKPSSGNPFLPFDPDMWVADISATHVCLLNKFNVVPHHVLLVTRSFVEQSSPLQLSDFETVVRSWHEFDCLVFYNSAPTAGASQPHRHLQLVPLPLRAHQPRVPIESLLANQPCDRLLELESLPYRHQWIRWSEPPMAGQILASYRNAMESLEESLPYNLLMTREWMLLVPRSHEKAGSLSLNALAYFGVFLARNEAQLAELQTIGLFEAWRETTFPRR